MNEKESSQSLLESSAILFKQGFKAFKDGDTENARRCMQNALDINQYDIGAMIILSRLNPEFKCEEGLFSSEEHRKAFAEIRKSPHVRNLYAVGNNLIMRIVQDGGLEKLKIVDIGIGTAAQEEDLIHRLKDKKIGIKKIEIIGIEPMPEMSAAAAQNLQSPEIQGSPIKIDYENIPANGQDIPSENIQALRKKIVDIVLATISIHHGTIEEKRKTLRAIREMNPRYFVLTDVNSDHESDLEAFSDDLAENVRQFYSLTYQTLCEWADEYFPGRKDIKAAFKKFNFDEARNILCREYSNVRDYHTSAERWRKLLKEEGFDIVNPKSIDGITNRLEGTTEVTDDTIYMLITEGRKLFFAVIAQPL